MKIENYDEVRERISVFLPEYLESHGIKISPQGTFRCINPSHEDKNPSCALSGSGPDAGKVFNCFSCGCKGSIFHAVHYLENKPIAGIGFITENLMYLAKKFGVEVEAGPLTEEEIYELDTFRVYARAADYITNSQKDERFFKTIEERKWPESICKEFGIGCISSYVDFRENFKLAGFSAGFLDDVDLSRKDIFGEDRLVFTIRDEHGRPVGFAGRNLSYNGEGSKYVNQKHTGVKCNIYKKSTRLYGLDRFLRLRKRADQAIYIFEGYSDVVTAALHGIKNCVALGGSSISPDQIQLLKQHNLYSLILCLDSDEKGQERTQAILDSILINHKDLNIRIVVAPDGLDPDDFIKQEGVNKFKRLKKQSAFEWRLSRFNAEAEGDEVCKAMIPLIVNEVSYIEQEKHCKSLALATGVSLKAIQSDVERLQNVREAEKQRQRDLIIEKMTLNLKRKPENAENVLYDAERALFDLARQYDEDSFSSHSCLSALDSQKRHEESKDGSFSGFILGEDLKELEQALCGEWKQDVFLCFGGRANVGKTSTLVKIAYEIANHEENDAVVIYHSIDDTVAQLLPKLVCVAEGSKSLLLNEVTDPNYHIKSRSNPSELLEKREIGYTQVRHLMEKERLILKDINDGSSIAFAGQLIRYFQTRYPNRKIVYVLDNLHKCTDFKNEQDERVRFKTISSTMKDLATRLHVCILATVEYRKIKKGDRAINDDISETGKIIYDASLITHIYNDVHENGDKARYYHTAMVSGREEMLPILELEMGKNKITSFKNKLYLNFFPACSDFSRADMGMIQARNREIESRKVNEKEAFLE